MANVRQSRQQRLGATWRGERGVEGLLRPDRAAKRRAGANRGAPATGNLDAPVRRRTGTAVAAAAASVAAVLAMTVAPAAAAIIFSENFDGVTAPALPAGWTATGQWATSAIDSDTPPNNAWAIVPAVVSDSFLDSPVIALTAPEQLTFRNEYVFNDSGGGFDGGVLEIKIGAGAFTDILAAGGSFAAGGYNGTILSGTGSPIAGRQAWTGGAVAYVTTTVDLPAAAVGQNIQLRWRSVSDSSVTSGPWRVDTIQIGKDTTPPTVSINQASGQADPTSVAPINFTAMFSEPVTGFSAADVSFAGSTAGGTLVASVSGSGPSYTVAVSGMTTAGVVRVSIPAGAAADGAGNASLASAGGDNSVQWQAGDTTPPACAVTAVRRPGPSGHDEMDVTLTDTGSGLQAVTNLVISNGVGSVTPSSPFAPGVTRAVLTVQKSVQGSTTSFSFDVVDRAGNVKHCA